MGNGSKRQYTLEFKQQAAELAKEIGISQAALKLGISVSAIRHWKIKHEGLGVSELRKLKQQEDDIDCLVSNNTLKSSVWTSGLWRIRTQDARLTF